ncbi:hypothetical protein [Pelagicoccus sp. SDUM812003]|uniref:hypothetical protein n=1 Tax=Pelagicoccus sp. SDUM812003 TaxID=3041267 RepID=UPI002810959C|nr:hypothetical protein [Pelagicoccus sp. SDUM812003]MDQ8202705.1 hypothetical protein [Pelagicoccus sp. SDUM812003]
MNQKYAEIELDGIYCKILSEDEDSFIVSIPHERNLPDSYHVIESAKNGQRAKALVKKNTRIQYVDRTRRVLRYKGIEISSDKKVGDYYHIWTLISQPPHDFIMDLENIGKMEWIGRVHCKDPEIEKIIET